MCISHYVEVKISVCRTSRVALRSKALHRSVQSQAVSLPAMTGIPIRRHTFGPALSGLGEGLAGALYLAHRVLVAGWAPAG